MSAGFAKYYIKVIIAKIGYAHQQSLCSIIINVEVSTLYI